MAKPFELRQNWCYQPYSPRHTRPNIMVPIPLACYPTLHLCVLLCCPVQACVTAGVGAHLVWVFPDRTCKGWWVSGGVQVGIDVGSCT